MELKELYYQTSIDKQLVIAYDGGEITNADIDSESMELEESLCSENRLTFGCCEASIFKIRVRNHVMPLKGKRLTVKEYLNGDKKNMFVFGTYTVDSDKPEANRTYRDIIAYDDMYRIINTDVSDWYNSLTFPMTLKQFRNSFFAWFGIIQEETVLVNDGMRVEETIKPSELSGSVVITCICEINGCFGHIGRDGKFQYVFLPEIENMVYPKNDLYPQERLFPADGQSERYGQGRYIKCTYEDFKTPVISKLQIRQEENDIGSIVGSGKETYVVEDNFLCYGKNAADLQAIAQNMFSVISKVSSYYPYNCTAIGNPCVNLGEVVNIYETKMFIESYMLHRVLNGVQALKDTLEAKGSDSYGEDVNSVNKSIIQLKGKVNLLSRTVEETKSEIKDMENGLTSSITQNASNITAEVKRAQKIETELSSKISQTAESITTKVSKDNIISEINQTAEAVKIRADKINLDGFVTMSSLQASGETIINGDNIRTGEISLNRLAMTGYGGSSWDVKWKMIYAFMTSQSFTGKYSSSVGGYVLNTLPNMTTGFWVLST